jgi:hypothetical protein
MAGSVHSGPNLVRCKRVSLPSDGQSTLKQSKTLVEAHKPLADKASLSGMARLVHSTLRKQNCSDTLLFEFWISTHRRDLV